MVAGATVAALKQAPPAAAGLAPAAPYAEAAVAEGPSIPSIVTLKSPHLGGTAYDIAADPYASFGPVAEAHGEWGLIAHPLSWVPMMAGTSVRTGVCLKAPIEQRIHPSIL